MLFEWLNNVQNFNDDRLLIYVPLAGYSYEINFADYIEDQTGFASKKLMQNQNNQIILLLDGFDEIFQNQEDKREDSRKALISSVKKLKKVKSVIITSRFDRDYFDFVVDEGNTIQFQQAEILPLENDQIESHLKDKMPHTYKNSALSTMISNPLFLTLLSSLIFADPELDVNSIFCDVQLMELYLSHLYEVKYGINSSKSYCYQQVMEYMSDNMRRINSAYGLETVDCLAEEKAYCFRSIVDFRTVDIRGNIRRKMDVNHAFFRDYFSSINIAERIIDICRHIKILTNGTFYSENFLKYPARRLALKREIKQEILELAVDMRAIGRATRSEPKTSSQSFYWCFSDYFYRCVAYHIKPRIEENALDLFYRFVRNEPLFTTVILEDHALEERITVQDELFRIISEYNSLDREYMVFDLKYTRKCKNYNNNRDLTDYPTYLFESSKRKALSKISRRRTTRNVLRMEFTVMILAMLVGALHFGKANIITIVGLLIAISVPILHLFVVAIVVFVKLFTNRYKIHSKLVKRSYLETLYVKKRKYSFTNYDAQKKTVFPIKRIVFVEGVKTVKNLYATTEIETIKFPKSLKKISDTDFSNWSGRIYYSGTILQWKKIKLKNCLGLNRTISCSDGAFIP